MEPTLKITSVLSDPTRFHIYEYMATIRRDVSVQEIADQFRIHPNVARLHLTKLEDVNLVVSNTQKTGKGGRPSRWYRLSDEVISLCFPFRDYQLLAHIAVQTLVGLGPSGQKVLREAGKEFGREYIANRVAHSDTIAALRSEEKIRLLTEAAGFLPRARREVKDTAMSFEFCNCPFKEIAEKQPETVCGMHHAFLEGMAEALFADARLIETENMMKGSRCCCYRLTIRP
ncbi:helix-turn-helix transcriptional regulator [Geobacillus icigianus]|uniref:Transcriptional regulator n=1 Tax=Geobacillus subterraneus TaxID=129338 RepID=A0A679FMZ4_9BACL|nr:helix-turn-helix domain-containing protein [Geobacillus subterraneus]BBW95607.1 transcriptional regulator [Geobacillus subterraneus]